MESLRRRRRWLPGWLVALLLFAQLATAAYACPRLAALADVVDDTVAAEMALMPGCSGDMGAMDPDQPQLCKAHCQTGQQTVNSGSSAQPSPLDAPLALAFGHLALFDAAQALEAVDRGSGTAQAAGPPAGMPPLYLLLHVLRN